MSTLVSVLLADGSSDRMLIPIMQNLLSALRPDAIFADILFAQVEGKTLTERVHNLLGDYPCDILFIHRDAEASQHLQRRYNEIAEAVRRSSDGQIFICVVPVKMTEAWLLLDESAIRKSVGNPSGSKNLGLPRLAEVESCNAKEVLFQAIANAIDLGVRRNRRVKPEIYRQRIAELQESLQPLYAIDSFKRFANDVKRVLDTRLGLEE